MKKTEVDYGNQKLIKWRDIHNAYKIKQKTGFKSYHNDRAILRVKLEKSTMYLIIKCNSVLPGMASIYYSVQNTKAIQSHNKESGGRDTNNFELLVQKFDHAYSAFKFERKYACNIKM